MLKNLKSKSFKVIEKYKKVFLKVNTTLHVCFKSEIYIRKLSTATGETLLIDFFVSSKKKVIFRNLNDY